MAIQSKRQAKPQWSQSGLSFHFVRVHDSFSNPSQERSELYPVYEDLCTERLFRREVSQLRCKCVTAVVINHAWYLLTQSHVSFSSVQRPPDPVYSHLLRGHSTAWLAMQVQVSSQPNGDARPPEATVHGAPGYRAFEIRQEKGCL